MLRGGTREPLTVVLVSYVSARLLMAIRAEPFSTPDTAGYQGAVSFTGGAVRPWLLPTMHLILDEPSMMLLQVTLSAVAFVVLAVALAATLEGSATRVALMAVVLLLGLNPRVTNWDAAMLSESLAISLTVLLIAALAHFRTMVATHAVALVGLFVVWGFARDANLIVGGAVGGILAGVAWRQRRSVAVAFVVCSVWFVGASMNNDEIEGFNVLTHLALGVGVEDPDTVPWFEQRGMPATDAFEIEQPDERLRALWEDPEMVDWAESEGSARYVEYTFAHPTHLVAPLGDIHLDDPGWKRPHDVMGFATIWPASAGWYTALLIAAAGVLWAAARRRRIEFAPPVLAVALIAAVPVLAMLAGHGSAMEHARHSLLMQFVLTIGLWWLVLSLIDAHRRSHSPLGGEVGVDFGLVVPVVADDELGEVHHGR